MRPPISLQNLVGISLESIEIDDLMVRRLYEAAHSSLQDAKLTSISNESRFDLAYKAIMQLANASLQANGYRVLTSKPGHHQLMLQSLPLTVGLDRSHLIVLDQLRKQRNAIDYSGDIVSETMLSEVIEQAKILMELVSERLDSLNQPIQSIHQANLELSNSEKWDLDEAPEISAEDLKQGTWAIDGKVVSEAEGRAAFAKKLRQSLVKQENKKPKK